MDPTPADSGFRPNDLVPFYDVETRRVVRIPASELRPGVVQARVEGIDGLVWILPQSLRPGEVRHPPFSEEVRDYLRQILTRMAAAKRRSRSAA